jgi:hypothetical protein
MVFADLPRYFALWNHRNHSFRLYESTNKSWITVREHSLRELPPPATSQLIEKPPSCRYGFTDVKGYGTFFFGVINTFIRADMEYQVVIGDYSENSIHDPLLFSTSPSYYCTIMENIHTQFKDHPNYTHLTPPPRIQRLSSDLLPLPTERVALALARDSVCQKEVCPITQDVLKPGKVAVTACLCVFQADPLSHWALHNSSCPSCRTPLAFRIVVV